MCGRKEDKDQFVITSVTYKLKKKPTFNITYGAIEQELQHMNVKELSIKAVSDAVYKYTLIQIAQSCRNRQCRQFLKPRNFKWTVWKFTIIFPEYCWL